MAISNWFIRIYIVCNSFGWSYSISRLCFNRDKNTCLVIVGVTKTKAVVLLHIYIDCGFNFIRPMTALFTKVDDLHLFSDFLNQPLSKIHTWHKDYNKSLL